MVYKHLHNYCCCMVKMPLKGEVEGSAVDSHGNYIVDHGKSWKNHGIVFLNLCGNPVISCFPLFQDSQLSSRGR